MRDARLIRERTHGQGMARLEAVVALLRGEDGCPWDRKQTLESLKPYLIEEAYELLDAIDADDLALHREELGDVLLQVVLQTQIRRERGEFDLDEVSHALAEKLIRRHPHVFGDVEVADSEEVMRNWEAIKADEKSDQASRSAIAGVPRHLPALLRAQRVQSKAARVGFDWSDIHDVHAKVDEELAELMEAIDQGDPAAIAHEMGDILFSLVNLSRFLKIDAETAMTGTVERFMQRFRGVESRVWAEDRQVRDCTLEELDRHWEAVKATEAVSKSRAASAPPSAPA